MGWSSGTEPFCRIAIAVKKHVKDEKAREAVHKEMIAAFESQDWDCQYEAMDIDPILDRLLESGD